MHDYQPTVDALTYEHKIIQWSCFVGQELQKDNSHICVRYMCLYVCV